MTYLTSRSHKRSTARLLALTSLLPGLVSLSPATPRAAAQTLAASATSAAAGTLSGVVTDGQGAALPHASVALHGGSVTRKTTTDAGGRFTLSNLPAGTYALDADAPGFGVTHRESISLTADAAPADINLALHISNRSEQITVEADASNSIAAHLAPMDARLDAASPRTEITDKYIRDFTAPTSDYADIVQNAPGTFSVNSNGVGLGDAKLYFRGFPDGDYDITFDGIPFEDTNSPSHHSWAFFPSASIGGVDFDRSPGTASTVGPTPFGGSINLLSPILRDSFQIRGSSSYGSFNTLLTDVQMDSGALGSNRKTHFTADVNHLTSDGFQTWNAQQRTAGDIKVQYAFSDDKVLTGFSNVELIDTNTPNTKGPTRAQYLLQYNYLLQNTDSTRSDYAPYNFYHIPTDFEYVGFRTPIAGGWHLDTKQYTYSYYNQQNYATTPKTGVIGATSCAPEGSQSCGVDKLNSYRRYGDISTFSHVSHLGILRAGMWYEWATTSRHQIPQNPITRNDAVLPNFNEQFWTNSYQPFAEYEWHPTARLALTGGLKYAHYSFDLKQYSDNGGAIGTLPAGIAAVYHSQGYNAWMPSADANFRLRQNWSVYGQFGTGSVIPPSNVFDVPNVTKVNGVSTLIANPVTTPPKVAYTTSYQGGTVLKLQRATLAADAYLVRFGNGYTASPDPNAVGAEEYQFAGNSSSKGFEGETNITLLPGLNLYLNGTAGTARYISPTIDQGAKTYLNPNLNHWVANTPANTETYGLTYTFHGLDAGFFNKRIGPMWNDNKATETLSYTDGSSASSSLTANQVIPIDPFNVANVFVNYRFSRLGRFSDSKLKLSMNNLLDTRNIISVTAATTGTTFTPASGDTLGLLSGRSVTMTFTLAFGSKR